MKILQPPVAGLSDIQLEKTSVDKFFHIYFAQRGLNDFGAAIELPYQIDSLFFSFLVDLKKALAFITRTRLG